MATAPTSSASNSKPASTRSTSNSASGTPGTPGTPGESGNGNANTGTPSGLPGGVAVKAPPFRIRSVSNKSHWLKLFVYGNYGTGKTRLAGSAALVPQMRDVLMIDAEAGDLTIATQEDTADHISVVRVSTFKELARVQEYLKAHCKLRDEGNMERLKELEKLLFVDYDPNAPAKEFNTVIVDSLSEAETFSMYQLLGINENTRLDEETQMAEWAEYKRNNSQILRLVRAFRDLPMNVIITSAASYTQDEFKRFVYQPSLTGKLSKQVQGFMDIVGFLVVTADGGGEDVRRMFVQPSAKYDAKNRLSSFKGTHFDNPTMSSILQAVGLLEKSSKAVKA